MDLHNYGKPCYIVKIENNTGNINWTNELPFYLKTNKYNYSFKLEGENYQTGNKYDFVIYLKTLDDKLYKYKIKGKNLYNTIRRIE